MQDANKTLTTTNHWLKFRSWSLSQEVDGVKIRAKRSGLSALIEHNYRCFDYVAITAFIER